MNDFSVLSLKVIEKEFFFHSLWQRMCDFPILIFPERHPPNIFEIFFPEQTQTFKCIFKCDQLVRANLNKNTHFASQVPVIDVLNEVRVRANSRKNPPTMSASRKRAPDSSWKRNTQTP